MPRTFRLPDVGEGVAEGELVTWLVSEGDTVEEDQPVAEVETDKAVVDVPSPVDGTVRELRVAEGDVVPVGDVIMVYNVEGEDDLEATAEAGQSAAEDGADSGTGAGAGTGSETGTEALEASDDAAAAAAVADATEADAADDAEPVGAPEGRVFAPPSTRRLARELGVDLEALEGSGHSGRITDADVRAAANGGTVETATPDSAEASSGGPANSTSAEPAVEEPPVEPAAGTALALEPGSDTAAREKTLATPATRRVAEEAGVDVDAVPTDEEKEGRAFVTEDHVHEFAEAQKKAQSADRDALAAGRSSASEERETREPYAGVRKSIGDAMERAKYTAPHVTHHDEVDVTDLVEARAELKPLAAERDLKLTYMPFVMKACTAALREYPVVNSSLDEDEGEIVTKHYYNLGVATATDAGLMVPVVDDVDRKGLFALQAEMNDLVEKARDRSIAVDEMRGGTFTITNVGGIGGEYATPILNYPEAAILALGSIQKKPRVVTDDDGNESIEPRHVMTVSLSFDHRIVDGAVAARFTNEVKEYLENPNLLLVE